MTKRKIIVITLLIACILLGIFTYTNKRTFVINEEELPINWEKDPKKVIEVYIKALNDKNIDLMKECIYSNEDYNSEYIRFGVESKERLSNIEYIRYIDSEESTFRNTEGMFKNGRCITFKEGINLEVEYDIKYKIENEPEESGINYDMYSLSKDKEGNYKIIGVGY